MTGFDRLARFYRGLEYLALGRSLEAARFYHAARLDRCRDVIIIGEGDGRFLAHLLRLAPEAQVRCIDSSRAMLDLAARRIDPRDRARVSFECADARGVTFEPAACDAVVTLFVLDCFTPADVSRLVRRLTDALRPGGLWLFADFALPAGGWRHWRAALWVSGLYAFFRWQAGIAARVLPPSEQMLHSAGLQPLADATLQHGLLRTALLVRGPDQT